LGPGKLEHNANRLVQRPVIYVACDNYRFGLYQRWVESENFDSESAPTPVRLRIRFRPISAMLLVHPIYTST